MAETNPSTCSVSDCELPARGRGMCRRHWQQWRRADPTPIKKRCSVEDRFLSKVDRSGGPFACWPYLGWRDQDGYGQFWDGAKTVRAQAFAWTLANGPMPAGKTLGCHRCDNPPCCNPAHIFPGSHADNHADCGAKGRRAAGDKNGTRRYPERLHRGAAHHLALAKLTPQNVAGIRQDLAEGDSTQREIAAKYGVSEGTISNIKRGVGWKWLS